MRILTTYICAAGPERAIHGLSPRPKPEPSLQHQHDQHNLLLPHEQSNKSPLNKRQHLQNLRREYYPAAEPRKRNLAAAPNPQTPLPPLHDEADLRILLHQRRLRPRGRHDPQPARPARRLGRAAPHLPPRPIPSPGAHPDAPATALQARRGPQPSAHPVRHPIRTLRAR